jgi:hypothetical protein
MTYVINTFFIYFDFFASDAGAIRRPGRRVVDVAARTAA